MSLSQRGLLRAAEGLQRAAFAFLHQPAAAKEDGAAEVSEPALAKSRPRSRRQRRTGQPERAQEPGAGSAGGRAPTHPANATETRPPSAISGKAARKRRQRAKRAAARERLAAELATEKEKDKEHIMHNGDFDDAWADAPPASKVQKTEVPRPAAAAATVSSFMADQDAVMRDVQRAFAKADREKAGGAAAKPAPAVPPKAKST